MKKPGPKRQKSVTFREPQARPSYESFDNIPPPPDPVEIGNDGAVDLEAQRPRPRPRPRRPHRPRLRAEPLDEPVEDSDFRDCCDCSLSSTVFATSILLVFVVSIILVYLDHHQYSLFFLGLGMHSVAGDLG
jgi:hypothetical protein